MRFVTGLAIAGALALTITAAARRTRFPEPDRYVPSLPLIVKIDGEACPVAPCVRCPAGDGPRAFALVTSAGARDLGPIEASCEKLEFRRDTVAASCSSAAMSITARRGKHGRR
jgi:hypothetical protein